MSTISASTTSTTAYKVAADTTGTLVLQTGATPTTALTLGTDQSATFAGAVNAPNTFGFKNRLINGSMVFDQRNAGASVTPASFTYTLDRWRAVQSVASKFSVQQKDGIDSSASNYEANSTPAGFKNSTKITSLSSYSVISSDLYAFYQPIEGFNTCDLGFGAAGASTVTLSFWVKSSLTGNFGGALKNASGNRSYNFSYTINAANTWEQKSITVVGDTTGTWLNNNGIGLSVCFSLGAGSTPSGSSGSWISSDTWQVTGSNSLVGTNGATWYITGVQLEKGSTATSFDYRPYGTELALCQRYYYRLKPAVQAAYGLGQVYGGNDAVCIIPFPVTMRIAPSSLEQSGTASDYRMWKANTVAVACTSVPIFDGSTSVICGGVNFTSTSLVGSMGQITQAAQNNTNGYLGWSAEL